MRHLPILLLVAAAVPGLVSCGGDESPTAPMLNDLMIEVVVSGNAVDPDGFQVVLRGNVHAVVAGEKLWVRDLAVGPVSVSLEGLAPHCRSEETKVDTRIDSEGEAKAIVFEVECYADLLYLDVVDAYDAHLIYMDDEGGTRPLTTPMSGAQTSAKWSPDGTKVAFVLSTEGGSDLYVADLEGGVWVVGDHPGRREREPEWSPDGEWLAYELTGGPEDPEIRLARYDGAGDHVLVAGDARKPAWSPDGEEVAFVCWDRGRGICFVAAGGGEVESIAGALEFPQSLSWSPDGEFLAYEGYQSGRQTIRVMRLSTDEVVSVIDDAVTYGMPFWSPDGSRLLVHSKVDSQYQLIVTRPFAGERFLITSSLRWGGDWSPDGRKIVLATSAQEIRIANPDGTGQHSILQGGLTKSWGRWRPNR